MQPAIYETTTIRIDANGYRFSTSTSKIVFEGFMSVYTPAEEEVIKKESFENLQEGDKLSLLELHKTQHFTQPPPHYNEASLVKTLEELGIGRPSTYVQPLPLS